MLYYISVAKRVQKRCKRVHYSTLMCTSKNFRKLYSNKTNKIIQKTHLALVYAIYTFGTFAKHSERSERHTLRNPKIFAPVQLL